MADFPGIPTKHIPVKTISTSIFPAALAEAKGAKISLSLFLAAPSSQSNSYRYQVAGSVICLLRRFNLPVFVRSAAFF